MIVLFYLQFILKKVKIVAKTITMCMFLCILYYCWYALDMGIRSKELINAFISEISGGAILHSFGKAKELVLPWEFY